MKMNIYLEYAIGGEKGEPITRFSATPHTAINEAKKTTGKTLYEMIACDYSQLYKDKYGEVKRRLLRHESNIITKFYAVENGTVITNVYSTLGKLFTALYQHNYTPVYTSLSPTFRVCVDTYECNRNGIELLEHSAFRAYEL